MAKRQSAASIPSSKRRRLRQLAKKRLTEQVRRLELERLEQRLVMTGPQLAGIQPNSETLLDFNGGTKMDAAPRSLTFYFDESQRFDDATLPSSIQVSRAGDDGLRGTADDVIITPGFLGSGDAPNQNQIVLRFQEQLPDDLYRVELFAFDDPANGVRALRNTSGEVLLPRSAGADRDAVDFELDLGAQIRSVVPQPITRNQDGSLSQASDKIIIYFNDDDMHETVATTNSGPTVVNPDFYKLMFTKDTASNRDDLVFVPDSVEYDPATDIAVLTFAGALEDLPGTIDPQYAGQTLTYRLRVGTDEVAPPAPTVLDLQGPSTPDTEFNISLVFPDASLSQSQQEIIRDAADRWEEIIIGDLPNEGLIDDIEITVRAQPIDGVGANIGVSVPTGLRRDTFIPFAAEIRLDSFDVGDAEIHQRQEEAGEPVDWETPTLFELAVKEMGFALGFQRLWNELDLTRQLGTADPRYIGANALREYNSQFNLNESSIPLENLPDREFRSDVVEATWREEFIDNDADPLQLNNELFTGYLSQTDVNLISRMTIGAFEDLGYVVNYGAADDLSTASRYIAPAEPTLTDQAGSSFDTAFDLGADFDTSGGDVVSTIIRSSIDHTFHNNGLLNVIADGSSYAEAQYFIVRDINGTEIKFEFTSDGTPEDESANVVAIDFTAGSSIEDMAIEIADKINLAGTLTGIPFAATAQVFGGHFVLLSGDSNDLMHSIAISDNFAGVVTLDPLVHQFDQPGGSEEPGHRQNQVEEHILGDRKDYTTEIATVYYNFKDFYGFDPDGNTLSNVITPEQRVRAREIFEIYGDFLGVQFVETADEGITIATGDMRAVRWDVPTGPGSATSISGGGIVILDSNESWTDDYGGDWFQEAMRQIGQSLGLGQTFDLPGLNILGSASNADLGINNNTPVEPVFPGDSDVIHGRRLYRPEQSDVDIYQVDLNESGLFTIETFAERLKNSSALDTVITLWTDKVDRDGNPVLDSDGRNIQTLVARNDDYYSEDSFLELNLPAGRYYIGVSASGNDKYNPHLENSGFGGTSEGDYELRVTFRAPADDGLVDDTRTRFDGDSDGKPGGVYNFWFRTAPKLDVAAPGEDAVIYIDKSNEPPVGQPSPNGRLDNPFNQIDDALNFISQQRQINPDNEFVVRIVGNGGADGDITTVDDNEAYQIGFQPPFELPLEDGSRLDVPRNTTFMVDAGAIFKMRRSSINVGSESPVIDRSGGAFQVLGVPFLTDENGVPIVDASGEPASGKVFFTSYNDEVIGADTNPQSPQTPKPGDYGGIIYRTDNETVEAQKQYEKLGIFLNYVNHADFRYGGGKILVNSFEQSVTPVHMIEARPTITYNTFELNSEAALSADPNSFKESNFHDLSTQFPQAYTSDYQRVGPEMHHNSLRNNTTNGIKVRVDVLPNNDIVPQTVNARWNDTSIVHVLTAPLIIQGTPGGAFLEKEVPPVDLITFGTPAASDMGTLTPGDMHNYRLTYVDNEGNESPVSEATILGQVSPQGALLLEDLPGVPLGSNFVGRRIYRSDVGGGGDFTWIAQIDATDTTYLDRGVTIGGVLDLSITATTGIRRARPDARLRIDPGTVVKADQGRIEVGIGAQLIAEGNSGEEIVFTSRTDDRFGGSQSFDTNNDDSNPNEADPVAGSWGGIVALPTSTLSIDNALVSFGGAGANAIEIHQAQARITNSVIKDNEYGEADPTRTNVGFTTPAAIFVRGAQPVIINNRIMNNQDFDQVDNDPNDTKVVAAVSINVNALNSELQQDYGRSTGFASRFTTVRDNQGPLFDNNQLSNNALNAVEVRGGVLTTEVVIDDTDIVHVIADPIDITNKHTLGGLRMESKPGESLVVKMESGVSIRANGNPLDITDPIGGFMHILGQPGFPVIVTSLHDDTVGAGFRPNGDPQTDTNNNGNSSVPRPGDWGSFRIDQYAHDRNVAIGIEQEPTNLVAPGSNFTANTAQFLGSLAPNLKSGDDLLRLGFEMHGFLTDVNDIDVYSFKAEPGTEVWLDIDRTTRGLDTVIELINSDGEILAQSNDSVLEAAGSQPLFQQNALILANPLAKQLQNGQDYGTTNSGDAGMRVVLPGSAPQGALLTYHVRVRSSSLIPGDSFADLQDNTLDALQGGHSAGNYQLQIRLRELDETPGSTIQFADIRYATNGVEVIGQPQNSPLQGDAVEILNVGATDDINDVRDFGVKLGNIVDSPNGSLTFSGSLGLKERPGFGGHPGFDDVDFFRFDVTFDNVQSIFNSQNPNNPELNNPTRHQPVTFDLDYGDQVSQVDSILTLYNEDGVVLAISNDSNIADDRSAPLNGADVDDLGRGSPGEKDPFIGPIELPEGIYYVSVTAVSQVPHVMTQFLVENPTTTTTRLEPIDSLRRIAEDRIDGGLFPQVVIVDDDDNVGPVVTGMVPPQGSVVEADIDFVSGTETQALNRVDLPGLSNIAESAQFSLIDGASPVPFNLGDVKLYVSENVGGINTQALRIVDPFTGHQENYVDTVGEDFGSLAIHPTTNELHSFTTEQNEHANYADDSNNATRYISIDAGTGEVYNEFEDGIDTFELDNGGVVRAHDFGGNRIGDGVDFEGMGFGTINGGLELLAIGSRLWDRGGNPFLPDPTTAFNVLYRFDPSNGLAISAPAPDRTGNGRIAGAASQIVERGTLDVVGEATGLAIMNGEVFVVTDQGNLYIVDNPLVPLGASARFLGVVEDENGAPIQFEGLDHGPANVEGGRYAGLLFGASADGQLYAFDPARVALNLPTGQELEPIFFNARRSVQINSVAPVTGISFSTLDFNLWHATGNRGTDDGHGIEPIADGSRDAAPGGTSLWFGFESAGANGIATNPAGAAGTYNFPGGAHGVIETNEFDLTGYSEEDLPILYFNYYLETEDQTYSGPIPFPGRLATDTFRVYVADDEGEWELLGTNNEGGAPTEFATYPLFDVQEFFDNNNSPANGTAANQRGVPAPPDNSSTTSAWRQARINLGPYAGRENLRLRFDFNTWGDSNSGDPLTAGDELRAIPGPKLRDEQSIALREFDEFEFPIADTRFEVDLGYSLVAPSGAKLQDGWQFTVDGVIYEFDNDDLNGDPDNFTGTLDNFGDGFKDATGQVLVPYHSRMTAEEVAEKMQIAIEENFVPEIKVDPPIGDVGFGTALANDTKDTAHRTDMLFGEYNYTTMGAIGDNFSGVLADPTQDVDIYKIRVNAGSYIDVTVDGDVGVAIFNEFSNLPVAAGIPDPLNPGDPVRVTYFENADPITDAPAPQIQDPPGRDAGAPRVGNGNAAGIPFPNGDPGAATPEGYYYVAISNTQNVIPGAFPFTLYDPTVEGSGPADPTYNFSTYDLEIDVSNPDSPTVDGSFADRIHGDDRTEVDFGYTFINTHRNGNRINIPNARVVTTTDIVGGQNTPYARFVEGAADVDEPTNERMRMHSGMSNNLVANQAAHVLADFYADGRRPLFKVHDETVDLVGLSFVANDLGPTGNTPGALGINRFGYVSEFNGRTLPGESTLDPAVDGQINGHAVFEASKAGNNVQLPFFPGAIGAQNNEFEGVYIDDIIIGFAERGELMTGVDTRSINGGGDFITNPLADPDAVLDGTYNVEIRKGSEYGVSIRPDAPDQDLILANYRAFDTNTRQGQSVSLVLPNGWEIYEGQKFTVSDGVNTLTFEYDDQDLTDLGDPRRGVDSGNVRIAFRDYDSADVIAGRVLDAFNSPDVQAVLKIVASTSDGADQASDGSTSNIITLHGENIVGGTANDVSVQVFNPFDFGEVNVDVTGARQEVIYKDGRYQTVVIDDTVQGDTNHVQAQGQIVISSNTISNVSNYGVFIDAGTREGANNFSALPNNPHAGPVRNLVELNVEGLVPGPAVINNLLVENGQGGVFFSGDANGFNEQLAPVPIGRIVNNTIYGGGSGVGVNMTENVAATLMNNIFSDLTIGVQADATTAAAAQLTGNLYNNNTTHSNIGLGGLAVDNDLLNLPMFVDPSIGNFYLESGSAAVDSSVGSQSDRDALVEVKEPLGIPRSPVIAPDRDLTFQLRVDDSEDSTPSGQVIDRGALDRADRSGPTAFLARVQDNDAEQLDIDPSETVVVRVDDQIHSFFEVQLFDGFGEVSSRGGIGIKDPSVVDSAVTVTRNGEFLVEGVDYHFAYNATSNRIRLTSLSGIWPTDSTYVVTLNNRDRFVLEAPSGGIVADGDQFIIEKEIDPNDPNRVLKQVFEYDSGYTVQVPQPLTVQVPVAGGGPGGIGDGQTFTINDPDTPAPPVVFEFDSNNTLLNTNNVAIPFSILDSHEDIAETMVRVIGAAGLGLSPSSLGNGGIHIAVGSAHTLDTGSSSLNSFGSSLAVQDGQSFTIDGNDFALTRFEFDLDGNVSQGAVRVPFRISSTRDDIGDAIVTAILNQNIGLTPQNFGGGNVHVGGDANDHVMDAIATSNLSLSGAPGVSRGLQVELPVAGGGVGGVSDSEFRVTNLITNVSRTFEFDSDGNNQTGNIIINYNLNNTISSREEIAANMVVALNSAGIGLNATDLGGGRVDIGGGIEHILDPLSANISITGVAGGAAAVDFVPNSSFNASAMALSIIDAVNDSPLPNVNASLRGGPTLFVEGATSISAISNFFLDGIKDLAENDLQPNQFSQETRFTILLGENRLDFGDNPDQTVNPQFAYPTLLQDDGARHVIFRDNPLFLGSRVDSDADGQPTVDANGDGIDADTFSIISTSAALTSGGNPVNGTFPLDVQVPQTFTLSIPVDGGGVITAGEQFTIDDGTTSLTFEFEDTANPGIGGDVAVPFNVGSTAKSIASSIVEAITASGLDVQPKTLVGGQVHVGTRTGQNVTLGAGSNLTLTGQALSIADGDLITVTTNVDTFVFEFDNDQNFAEENVILPLSSADTNLEIADQIVDAMLSVDMRFTPVHTGDGLINLSGLDEDSPTGIGGDGVSFNGAFNSFVVTPIEVTASGPGLLDAWIDFNRDGRWDNGEQIFSSEPIRPGSNALEISTPLDAVVGTTYARFRISQLGGLGPRGLAASGEVEDYKIEILPGNPPVAEDDPQVAGDYATDEDNILTVSAANGVLDNDTDPDNDPLTVLGATVGNPLVFTTVRGAEVTLNVDGSFTYDPTNSGELQSLFDQEGPVTDTFNYKAFDGFLFSQDATVTILVGGLNDNPVANPVTVLNAFEDGPLVNQFVDAFDIDKDDTFSQNPAVNTLNFEVRQDLPATGSGEIVNKDQPTFQNDGRFQFDPRPGVDFQELSVGAFQDVSFTYVAIDSHAAESNEATVTIRVNGVNDMPLANDMEILPVDGPTEDGPALNYLFDGDDIDSDDAPNDLIYHIVSQPAEGVVSIPNSGFSREFQFDPSTDFQDLSLNDSRFVTFTYQTEDSHGVLSAVGTVTVWVNGANDAPTAVNDPSNNSAIHDPDNFVTDEDTIITQNATLAELVDNDVDVDRLDTLQVFDPSQNGPVDDQNPLVITSQFGAEVTLFSNGQWIYNPLNAAPIQALTASDPDLIDTFTYRVTDGLVASANSATVNVIVSGDNDAPDAFDDTYTIDEDNTGTFTETLRADDKDSDDDPSTLLYQVIQSSIPPELLVQDNANGTFTYRIINDAFQDLGPGQTRDVSFQFRALDRHGVRSNPGTVTISVSGSNDPPVAVDDDGVVNEVNTSIQIAVLANDLDPEGNFKFNSNDLFNIVQPNFGSVTADLATGILTYTPAPNFQGSDSFTYTVRDVEDQVSNVATVSVITTDFPTTVADSASTFVGVPIDIDVLANDSDSDGLDVSSVQIAAQPANGTVEVLATGEIRYTPNLGFQGPTDAFAYTVADTLGARSAPTTVDVNVSANPTPHKNPIYAEDIDANGSMNAKDPLEIVAVLRTHGIGVDLPVPPAAPFLTPADPPQDGVRRLYRDPSGNNKTDLIDAFMVIDELNRVMRNRGGSPEGEGDAAAAVDALMSQRNAQVQSNARSQSGAVVDANADVTGDALLAALDSHADNPHLDRILEDLFRSGQISENDVDEIIGDVFGGDE